MSKYFNETQPKLDSGLLEKLNMGAIEEFLGVMKEASEPAVAMAKSRLEECRTLKLNARSNPLLISRLTEFNHQAAESYRALRTRITRLQSANGSRSFVVTSAAQGDGKTLTSANLAISFAQVAGARVLVIDADLHTRGLTKLFGDFDGLGLSDVLSGQATHSEAVCATDQPNLHFLSAGREASSLPELLTGPAFKELIGWASECFSIVIVDSPPLVSISDCELIIAACDSALVVVRALGTQRGLLEAAVSQLDQNKVAGFVYNSAQAQSKYGAYRYYSMQDPKRNSGDKLNG